MSSTPHAGQAAQALRGARRRCAPAAGREPAGQRAGIQHGQQQRRQGCQRTDAHRLRQVGDIGVVGPAPRYRSSVRTKLTPMTTVAAMRASRLCRVATRRDQTGAGREGRASAARSRRRGRASLIDRHVALAAHASPGTAMADGDGRSRPRSGSRGRSPPAWRRRPIRPTPGAPPHRRRRRIDPGAHAEQRSAGDGPPARLP